MSKIFILAFNDDNNGFEYTAHPTMRAALDQLTTHGKMDQGSKDTARLAIDDRHECESFRDAMFSQFRTRTMDVYATDDYDARIGFGHVLIAESKL